MQYSVFWWVLMKRYALVPEHLVPDTSALSIYFFWMIGYRRRVMISNQSILWLWFGLRYAFCVIFIDLSGTNRFKQSQKRAPPNLVGGSFLPSSLNIARVFRHRIFFIFFTALLGGCGEYRWFLSTELRLFTGYQGW